MPDSTASICLPFCSHVTGGATIPDEVWKRYFDALDAMVFSGVRW